MCAVVLRRPKNQPKSAAAVRGARRAPYPGFIAPCDPVLREQAPDGPQWLHEIKIDGYRAQLHLRAGRATIYSRRGYDWTRQFRVIAEAAQALSAHELIADGEASVLGRTGLPDFQALRRELAKDRSERLSYQAFDLLYLDGYDLRDAPLLERKRALERILAKVLPQLSYVDFLELEDGETVYRRRSPGGRAGCSSITCGTDAARLRSAPIRRERDPAFRWRHQ